MNTESPSSRTNRSSTCKRTNDFRPNSTTAASTADVGRTRPCSPGSSSAASAAAAWLAGRATPRTQGLYNSPTAAARFRAQYAELIEQLDQLAEPTEDDTPAPDFSILQGRPVEEVWESLDGISDRARLLRQAIDRIEVKAGRRGAPRGSNRGARFDTSRVDIHWSAVLGG